ncbi:MAG: hypothetical protein HQL69_17510 [Magnetococcales bacterium]|nr:hypothetical protein [Magnetococcales bacterium]
MEIMESVEGVLSQGQEGWEKLEANVSAINLGMLEAIQNVSPWALAKRTTMASMFLVTAGCSDSSDAETKKHPWNCDPAPSCNDYKGRGENKNHGSFFNGKWTDDGYPDTGMRTDRFGNFYYIENGGRLTSPNKIIIHHLPTTTVSVPTKSTQSDYSVEKFNWNNDKCGFCEPSGRSVCVYETGIYWSSNLGGTADDAYAAAVEGCKR